MKLWLLKYGSVGTKTENRFFVRNYYGIKFVANFVEGKTVKVSGYSLENIKLDTSQDTSKLIPYSFKSYIWKYWP